LQATGIRDTEMSFGVCLLAWGMEGP